VYISKPVAIHKPCWSVPFKTISKKCFLVGDFLRLNSLSWTADYFCLCQNVNLAVEPMAASSILSSVWADAFRFVSAASKSIFSTLSPYEQIYVSNGYAG